MHLILSSPAISWVLGDAMSLPFPNNSFDAYTIAFGIRNVPNIRQVYSFHVFDYDISMIFTQVVSEANRVLVPGGRFMCMEFSHIQNPILKQYYHTHSLVYQHDRFCICRLYDIYSFQLIPVYGELIAQDRSSYQYLVESIRQFPPPVRLCLNNHFDSECCCRTS